MEDKQFQVGDIIEGYLHAREERATRIGDNSVLTLFEVDVLTQYRLPREPHVTASHRTAIRVAFNEQEPLPPLNRFSVDFTGRVTAILPPTRRMLSRDRRTTYLLEDFKMVSATCTDRPPDPVETFVKSLPSRLARFASRFNGPR
jgi:hypothetical protein